MMLKKMNNKSKDLNNGWSQFEAWAGSDWFGNKPVTPPCTKEENVAITDGGRKPRGKRKNVASKA